MVIAVSPAVARAAEAARALAAPGAPTLGHWLAALLDDPDAAPAALVERLGLVVAEVLNAAPVAAAPPAPPEASLLGAARLIHLEHSGDGVPTTGPLLVAVLEADGSFRPGGLTPEALRELLPPRLDRAGADDAGPELVVEDPSVLLEAARVVDANLNRSLEALRVLDDYVRFVRDDRPMTAAVKQLRHDLVEAGGVLPARLLLAARSVPTDVGASVRTTAEYRRGGAADVGRVNLRRLQESLRSLEEFGKVLDAGFAAAVEQLRYRAYTLEAGLQPKSELQAKLEGARLYALVSAASCVAAIDWMVGEMIDHGVGVVQLREKDRPDREILDRARLLRRVTARRGVILIVNDRPDLARLAGADGVHLGQDDLGVADARRIVGADALVGVSTHNLSQVEAAIAAGADYLGAGPTFPSRTKEFAAFPGVEFAAQATAASRVPVFALGGITTANVPELVAAGVRRVAVASALCGADEPGPVAAHLLRLLGS